MSRFSKSEAESKGWVFAHAQKEERTLRPRDAQGRTQVLPPSYRAEKRVDTRLGDQMVNEEAETMGLLLERIHAYETFQGRLEDTSRPPEGDASYTNPYGEIPVLHLADNPKIATDDNKRDQADNETFHQTKEDDIHRGEVQTPDGTFSEHEFFGRRSEEAVDAHANFLARQREFELAKPIDPTPTQGERNEEPRPQVFGPPNPEVEILIAQGPGPERTEETKEVGAKSKPSHTEKEARKQSPKVEGKAGSKEQPAVPTHRQSDSPPEDHVEQLVEAPKKSPTDETETRAKKQVASEEPKETTTGVEKERKQLAKEKK